MYGFSTVTQKGQIVIPAEIRKALNIMPSTRVQFKLQGSTIYIKPTLTIRQGMGIIKTKIHATEEDYDKAIKEAVLEKFRRRGLIPK